MKLKAFHGDEQYDVEIEAVERGYVVVVDGRQRFVDATMMDGSFYSFIVDGRSFEVSVAEEARDTYSVRRSGSKQSLMLVDPLAVAAGAHLGESGPAELSAAMPGRVVKVLVEKGQEVEEGQGIIVLEAMKMENEVEAPRAGTVSELFVEEGATLETGGKIAVIG